MGDYQMSFFIEAYKYIQSLKRVFGKLYSNMNEKAILLYFASQGLRL